jgi:putative hydrolase of the HAD superfamily
MRRHTLLIDADDTLWENNVFFEKLIEDFITIVEPYGYTRAYIRHILNETERKNIRQYGYGVRSFGRSLEETYIKLADQMAKREILALIHSRVMDLERTPPKILDGAPACRAFSNSSKSFRKKIPRLTADWFTSTKSSRPTAG